VIVNRDPRARAELVALVNEKMNTSAESVIWNTQYRLPAATSIEVNATSIGLYPDSKGRLDIDLETVEPHMIVADVIPNPPRTTLIRDADARGCVGLDGLGILVNQGVISIRHWTGVDADPAGMRNSLEALFDALERGA
jgi:shikimate dehydrogenase